MDRVKASLEAALDDEDAGDAALAGAREGNDAVMVVEAVVMLGLAWRRWWS